MTIADKILQNKLTFFETLVETIPNPIFYKDEQGTYLGCNRAFEKYIGFSNEELIGKTVFDIAPQDLAEVYHQADLKLINQPGTQVYEASVLYGDGSKHEVIFYKASFFKDDGAVGGLVGVINDITERKQVERKIQEQLNFSNALNRIAENIISHADTQTILENMVRIVGETIGLDRALIFDINLEHQMVYGLCEWNNPDQPDILPAINNWSTELFKNTVDYYFANNTWLQSHIDDIDPQISKDGLADLIHQELAVKSLLYFPFAFQPLGCYLLVFHQVQYRRQGWDKEIEFVEAAAKLVEIAIQKIRFIEAQRKTERIIWEEKERAQTTLQSIRDAVITTDSQWNIEYLNPVAEGLTGWTNDEAHGLPVQEVFHIIDEKNGLVVENPIIECISEGRIRCLGHDTILIHRGGHKFAIEDSVAPIKDRSGNVLGAILVFRDVSEKRSLIQQMLHQSYHDPLTSLPNRILFNDRLTLALANSHLNNEKLAILFIDLDNFKDVNDTMGHAVGDLLLKEIANRLGQCVREGDTIARLGGDEFTILLPDIAHEKYAAKVALKIKRILQQPWIHHGQEFQITVSTGIALYPNDGEDAENLLKHADTAMYRAKEQGKNNYQFYNFSMKAKIIERLNMEKSIRQAIKEEEFTLYYQPQVCIETKQIIGFEALIRWEHPERGLVGPDQFIPVAEETGLIISLGLWVLYKACEQNKAWQNMGLRPIRVTVNLSAYQFKQNNIVQLIRKVLNFTKLDPQWLEIEITESALIQDVDFTIKTLQALRKMGVYISVDDFGTGYSSLNYLKRLPIQKLKIDRSFINEITINSDDQAIVSTIIVLAKNLNLKVIAEGVETKEQVLFLESHQCMEMQGFYFSKPLPPEEIQSFFNYQIFASA